jgi:arylsulfatase A-like enzyme
MNLKIDRREFLKLFSLFSFSYALASLKGRAGRAASDSHQNVFIIVFDALSALNIPFYGYQRNTMPNLSRIIEKATVYHNHYAGGNYTTPGTASLLTGTLPWTHRAFQHYGTVAKPLATHNIFNAFSQSKYYNTAYSHNPYVIRLLDQIEDDLVDYIPQIDLCLNQDWVVDYFSKDWDIAELSRQRIVGKPQKNTPNMNNSLFLPELFSQIDARETEKIFEQYGELFPQGVPKLGNLYYILEDGIDFLTEHLGLIPQPFFGYFHFLPPHQPYKPRREFTDLFTVDDINIPKKPEHIFSQGKNRDHTIYNRLAYDRNISYVDAEFARLFEYMESSGSLENTWLIFTTDHGEMFERGIIAHNTESLHEPVIKIPLMIFEPGQTSRRDIFTPTSCIDVLPTLLHVTDQEIPNWVEGEILPPYRSSELDTERSVFSVQARRNRPSKPLTRASVAMIKGQFKIHAYFGYAALPSGETLFEVYDLKNDPEELHNLYSLKDSVSRDLQNELEEKLKNVNKPFL